MAGNPLLTFNFDLKLLRYTGHFLAALQPPCIILLVFIAVTVCLYSSTLDSHYQIANRLWAVSMTLWLTSS